MAGHLRERLNYPLFTGHETPQRGARMANVAFDYTNLVEVEGGIDDGELQELGPRL